VISSFIVAVVVAKVLSPAPRVRFSSRALIRDNLDLHGDGKEKGRFLTCRLVRESGYNLRDCEVSLLARWHPQP
jgi:hypothetical protein